MFTPIVLVGVDSNVVKQLIHSSWHLREVQRHASQVPGDSDWCLSTRFSRAVLARSSPQNSTLKFPLHSSSTHFVIVAVCVGNICA
jgi:hypothetical protein